MSNGLFIGDKDPVEIRVGNRKATSVFLGDKKVWSNVPDGAILHLNAKGLTTEGIAESGGVVDLSGNGNNGTAYGGVSVVTDNDMGECFDFNNGDIRGDCSVTGRNVSVCFDLKVLDNATIYGVYFLSQISDSKPYIYLGRSNTAASNIQFRMYRNDGNYFISYNLPAYVINEARHIGIVIDYDNLRYKIFINGILVRNATYNEQQLADNPVTGFTIGRLYNPYYTKSRISNVYIYPRALTAHEVKKLYLASRR